MAIFRCSKCGHLREVGNDYLGKTVKCPKCEKITRIHDTVTFLNALIGKCVAQSKELQNLRQESSAVEVENEVVENMLFEEIDIYNTDILTQANNTEPILKWFEERKIQININPDAVGVFS